MNKKAAKKAFKVLIEVLICFVIAVVLVGVIQQFFFAPISVSGSSMAPTIHSSGDKVYVQKKGGSIKRGDVIVFYRPTSSDVTGKNPAKSITFSDFMNSLPFVNKIPRSSDESSATSDYTCVIKRVIGVPGDVIRIEQVSYNEMRLYRNDKEVSDFLMHPLGMGMEEGVRAGEWTVGKGQYYVMGDNRNNSYDSNDYGCIDASWVMGKVIMAKIGGKIKFSI